MIRRLLAAAAVAALAFMLGGCDPQPSGPGGTWTLDFHDEFDGTTLDSNKWTPSWFTATNGYSHPVNGLEDNCYAVDNVVLYGGSLVLAANPNSDPDCERRDGTTAPYAGSIVVSDNKFQSAIGVWEWRASFPGPDTDCDGGDDRIYNWPAMWTNGDHQIKWPDNGEIDVSEGGSSGMPRWNVHSTTVIGSGNDDPDSGPSWCGQGWHTYTMQRTAARCDFWVDGVSKGGTTDCARFAGDTHYAIMANQFDTDRLTDGDAPVLVDYVRHWVQ